MTRNNRSTGKALISRPGIGITAGIVQHCDLRLSHITVDRPAMILVRHGTKILRANNRQWVLHDGEAIALAGGQVFDVTNRLSENGLYEARWLIWDPLILDRFAALRQEQQILANAAPIGALSGQFATAFDRALEAIQDDRDIPEEVAAHRLTEILLWLARQGIVLSNAASPTLSARLRSVLENNLAEDWTSAKAARCLAMSEATLRRHLAKEGVGFASLLSDLRMSSALMLLQSTDFPINRIALEVGYASPSRFATRFRARFGIAPTIIRGHRRLAS